MQATNRRRVVNRFVFGSPAISKRPVALRPDLATGLPFSENPFRVPRKVRENWYTEVPVRGAV